MNLPAANIVDSWRRNMDHALLKRSNKYLVKTWPLDDYFGKGTVYLFANGNKQVSVCDRSSSGNKIDAMAINGPSLYFGDDIVEAAIAVSNYLK